MLKKIGIGVAILLAGCAIYFLFIAKNPYKLADTSTTKKDRTAEITLRPKNKPAAKKDRTALTEVSAIPKLNIIKPDQEIEAPTGVKVAQEKPMGLRAEPECYRVVKSLLKTIKSISVVSGLIVFNSEESMSGVEVILAVNEFAGDTYYSLAEEKGSVRFNYIPIEGDLNGQTRPTVKIFAVGIIDNTDEYVILECPDVLAARKVDGVRTICLSPVIAGLKSKEATRKVLEEQFYVSEAGLQLLIPQIEVSQR